MSAARSERMDGAVWCDMLHIVFHLWLIGHGAPLSFFYRNLQHRGYDMVKLGCIFGRDDRPPGLPFNCFSRITRNRTATLCNFLILCKALWLFSL